MGHHQHLHKPGAGSDANSCSDTSYLTSPCTAGASSLPTPWIFYLHLFLPPPRAHLSPRHLSHLLHGLPMILSVSVFVWEMLPQLPLSQLGHLYLLLFSLCCHHDLIKSRMQPQKPLHAASLLLVNPVPAREVTTGRSLRHLTCIFLSWTAGGTCHHQPRLCLKSSPGTGAALAVLGACRAC